MAELFFLFDLVFYMAIMAVISLYCIIFTVVVIVVSTIIEKCRSKPKVKKS